MWNGRARLFRLPGKWIPHHTQSNKCLRLRGGKGESSFEIRYLSSFINTHMCIPLTSGIPQQLIRVFGRPTKESSDKKCNQAFKRVPLPNDESTMLILRLEGVASSVKKDKEKSSTI